MRGAKAVLFGVFLAVFAAASPVMAQQMSESCQKEFLPLMEKRQAIVDRINSFSKRKPTAAQACGVFRELTGHNQKIGTWMTAQKDWCQVPDAMIAQFTEANGQAAQTRDKICGVAAQHAKQAKQAQQAPRGGQPAGIGSGVKLPNGAL